MAKKFYAVAVGRKPGIYTDTAEMDAQTKEYPNQLSKGFNELAQAKNWLKQHQIKLDDSPVPSEPATINSPLTIKPITIYTDGSYRQQSNPTRVTIGYISMMTGDFAEQALTGNAHKTITAEEQPYASSIAEIEAALAAIKDAINHGYNVITIRHDCNNIPDLLTSVNNFKNNPSIMAPYREQFTTYLTRAAIRFEQVTGHANDVYNNMVHNLTQL